MTAIVECRESTSLWNKFCSWITSTENGLYIGWFVGVSIIFGSSSWNSEDDINFLEGKSGKSENFLKNTNRKSNDVPFRGFRILTAGLKFEVFQSGDLNKALFRVLFFSNSCEFELSYSCYRCRRHILAFGYRYGDNGTLKTMIISVQLADARGSRIEPFRFSKVERSVFEKLENFNTCMMSYTTVRSSIFNVSGGYSLSEQRETLVRRPKPQFLPTDQCLFLPKARKVQDDIYVCWLWDVSEKIQLPASLRKNRFEEFDANVEAFLKSIPLKAMVITHYSRQ